MDPYYQNKRDVRTALARMARREFIGGIPPQHPMDEAQKERELSAQIANIELSRARSRTSDTSYQLSVPFDNRFLV